MPSLVDLFKSKKLTNGQTAQTNNAVRNGKDIPITTNSILLNKNVLPTFNKLRNGFSVDLNKTLGSGTANVISSLNSSLGSPINVTNGVAYVKKDVVKNTYTETLSEENFLGLRPLHLLSTPFLYGTNTIRLTTQSTYAKDLMVANRNATPNSIGGLISSARVAVAGAVNSVGLYPYPVYPSLLVKERYKGRTFKEAWDAGESMDFIYGLKKKSEGIPIIGDLIKGTIKNLKTGLGTNEKMGQYATSAKALVTKIFLGNNRLKFPKAANTFSITGGTLATLSQLGLYGPDTLYSELKGKKNSSTISERNDLSDLLQLYNNPTPSQQQALIQAGFPVFTPLTLHSKSPKAGKAFGNNQSFEISEDQLANLKFYLGEKGDGTDTFSKMDVNTKFSIQNKYQIKYGGVLDKNGQPIAVSDSINATLPLLTSKDDKSNKVEKEYDGYDFVTLKFSSPLLPTQKTVWFRSTISGLTETISPTWDTQKFIGNPFPLYTYNQVERVVQFTFKAYSFSRAEHITMWEKINFLTSLCYPQEYSDIYSPADLVNKSISEYTHVTPPFIKFTLGSMFKNKWAYIESLTYTVDDSYTWETGIGEIQFDNKEGNVNRSAGKLKLLGVIDGQGLATSPDAKDAKDSEVSLKDYILPQIIDINISLKIVESMASTVGGRYYIGRPFTAVPDLTEIRVDSTNKASKMSAEVAKKRAASLAAGKPLYKTED
jgi:hypothetical protein